MDLNGAAENYSIVVIIQKSWNILFFCTSIWKLQLLCRKKREEESQHTMLLLRLLPLIVRPVPHSMITTPWTASFYQWHCQKIPSAQQVEKEDTPPPPPTLSTVLARSFQLVTPWWKKNLGKLCRVVTALDRLYKGCLCIMSGREHP